MRELSNVELGAVSGADGSDLGGAAAGAACGFLSKTLVGAVGCAIAGELVSDLLDAGAEWGGPSNPPGGGDYSNPGYKNG